MSQGMVLTSLGSAPLAQVRPAFQETVVKGQLERAASPCSSLGGEATRSS
jgi:hypothetical protein